MNLDRNSWWCPKSDPSGRLSKVQAVTAIDSSFYVFDPYAIEGVNSKLGNCFLKICVYFSKFCKDFLCTWEWVINVGGFSCKHSVCYALVFLIICSKCSCSVCIVLLLAEIKLGT